MAETDEKARDFGDKGRFEREQVFGARATEVKIVQVEQSCQLAHRCGVIVDAKIGEHVVSAAISGPRAHDEQGGTLTTSPVTAGGVSGRQGCKKASGKQRLVFGVLPRTLHGLDHLGSGQDVSLDGVPFARYATGPRVALSAGERCGAAVCVHQTDLALLATVITGDE